MSQESEPTVETAPAAEHHPETSPATQPVPAALPPSVLERVRSNRMGPLAVALGVAVVVGLLLAALVPARPNLLALGLLGALLTAAVGFTTRYLSVDRGIWAQLTGFVATVIGLHLMTITGGVDAVVGQGAQLLALIGAEGPQFDDALLGALATPAVSTGGVLCGLIAAIIVGWGPRDRD